MKKNDLILASAMLFIALVWFIINNLSNGTGDLLVVYQNNIRMNEYSLNTDGEYRINDSTGELMNFVIKNGTVNVINACCPDKLCVHQKSIHGNNEVIVCLPNKIVLKIGNKDNINEEYDAITK